MEPSIASTPLGSQDLDFSSCAVFPKKTFIPDQSTQVSIQIDQVSKQIEQVAMQIEQVAMQIA